MDNPFCDMGNRMCRLYALHAGLLTERDTAYVPNLSLKLLLDLKIRVVSRLMAIATEIWNPES